MRDLEGVERGWCPICVERYSFSSASNRAASRSLHWSELAKSCLEFQPQSPIRRRLQELRKPSGRSPGSKTAPTTTSIADPNIICPAAPGDPAPAVDSVVDSSFVHEEGPRALVAQDGREVEQEPDVDEDDLCRHCGCPASSHARLSLQQSEKDVLTFVRPVFKQRQFSVSNGISVSVTEAFRMAREKNEERNEEFVYGEILENTFLPLLNELWSDFFYSEDQIHLHREKQKRSCRRGGVFYDLGCGFGKAAVLAALSDWNFESCVGVELLPDLLSVGQKMVKELLEKTQEVASDESTSCSSSSTSSSTSTSAASNITTGSTATTAAAAAVRFSEYTKDTLAEQHAVWREQLKQVGFEKRDLNTYQVPPDARLIYVAATMFKEDLRQNIRRNLANVDPKNTLLVTIQHQLPDTLLVREVKLACSWGITKAFVCKLPG